jgi:DNA-binding NarL/FixJ family response regulator
MNILIVEDEPMIAEDIAMTLAHAKYTVVGISYNLKDAINILDKNVCDIVLLDINLNGTQDGLNIAQILKEKYNLPFIFITSYSDKETLSAAKLTQPCGYIVKPFSDASLLTTFEVAMVNYAQRYKSEQNHLDFGLINSRIETSLSEREQEVLKLIYDGMTNVQISKMLFISINTIKKHINNSYLKIDATTRSNAIARLRKLSSH